VSAQVDRVLIFAVIGNNGVASALAVGAYGRPSIWAGGNVVIKPFDPIEVVAEPSPSVTVKRPEVTTVVTKSTNGQTVAVQPRVTHVVTVQDGVKKAISSK
jgi:hypothetical protein